MVLVTWGGILAAFLIARFIGSTIIGTQEEPDLDLWRRVRWGLLPLSGIIFILLFSIFNSIITHRMIKKIIKPLDVLGNGVRQIQANNFSHRIEYNVDDEFRPVCETFNKMAAQLEASAVQRLKDEANRRELLAGISHDLRTPLTTINGYLDGLESGVASTPEKRTKYFNTIKNNSANMKHIIEQLFLFSKLDMDEFPFTPQSFNITRAIVDMTEELIEEYAKQGLTITVTCGSEKIFINADVSHIRRVVLNILSNSAKYKKSQTARMEINISADNGFVLLKFTDDGPGVDPEALADLFNVFYRADPSRNKKGSGLGLAISAKIIERSGGCIHAENADTGGLAIIIRLPITEAS